MVCSPHPYQNKYNQNGGPTMDDLTKKFNKLGIEFAPGQEALQKKTVIELRGECIDGIPVDFSHGNVDAFCPLPGSQEAFNHGFEQGGEQAYTEYRGKDDIRARIAGKLSGFTGAAIDSRQNLIITPGTQGALFLAMGALIGRGDKVAIVEPDYFANRKLVAFFDGEIVPVPMDYLKVSGKAGLNLEVLERAFQSGVKLFVFSNPNNPTGVIYSSDEIGTIASLARKYQAALIVDELYSRQIYDGKRYTHLCAEQELPDNLITIIGPSKTESLSGFRLGVAFGTKEMIARMEKLQAIVSLRAAGYCQAVLNSWFEEPEGFMAQRTLMHQQIRNDIAEILSQTNGIRFRLSDGGSYLFVELPPLDVSIADFVKIVHELTSVTVTPGTEFGPQFTNHFRINFSQDHDAAVQAVKRVVQVMERYRKQV